MICYPLPLRLIPQAEGQWSINLIQYHEPRWSTPIRISTPGDDSFRWITSGESVLSGLSHAVLAQIEGVLMRFLPSIVRVALTVQVRIAGEGGGGGGHGMIDVGTVSNVLKELGSSSNRGGSSSSSSSSSSSCECNGLTNEINVLSIPYNLV